MADLRLPEKAGTAKYSHENHDADQIAVYALVKIQGVASQLHQALAQDSTVADSYVLSEEDFVNKPLRDVLTYHLNLAGRERFYPTLFVAVQSANFVQDGVLLINANFDLEGGVDKCRVKVWNALLTAVNLQIGNIDWWDVEREDSDDSAPRLPHDDSSVQAPIVFGAYGITTGANMTKIRDLLEPGWQDKAAKAWLCESVGSYTSGTDQLHQVIRHHPWHCLQKPQMSKQWCICVDNLNPSEEGVLLLHIDWDGDMKREPKDLLEVGAQSQFQTERVDVSMALNVLTAKQG